MKSAVCWWWVKLRSVSWTIVILCSRKQQMETERRMCDTGVTLVKCVGKDYSCNVIWLLYFYLRSIKPQQPDVPWLHLGLLGDPQGFPGDVEVGATYCISDLQSDLWCNFAYKTRLALTRTVFLSCKTAPKPRQVRINWTKECPQLICDHFLSNLRDASVRVRVRCALYAKSRHKLHWKSHLRPYQWLFSVFISLTPF